MNSLHSSLGKVLCVSIKDLSLLFNDKIGLPSLVKVVSRSKSGILVRVIENIYISFIQVWLKLVLAALVSSFKWRPYEVNCLFSPFNFTK